MTESHMDKKLECLSYRVTPRTISRKNRMVRVRRRLKYHLVKYTKVFSKDVANLSFWSKAETLPQYK